MKKYLSFFLIALFAVVLGACNQGQKKETKKMTEAINPANMDKNVKPGNNFYEYVNGGWIKNHPIPPEYSQYGAFTVLYENNQKELKALVKEISEKKDVKEGSIEQKIRDFYNSGMDTVRIEKLGITPIKPELEKIAAITNLNMVQKEMAQMSTMGVHPLFYFYAGADDKNSTMEIANLYQGGLGLPDVSYYTKDDPASKKLREEYTKHIAKMFELKGDNSKVAVKKAEEVLNLETKLAKTSFTRLERRSPEKNYNKMTLAQLQKISHDINWKAYFTNIGLNNPGDINVGQPRFFIGISKIMKETPVNVWKS